MSEFIEALKVPAAWVLITLALNYLWRTRKMEDDPRD